ncbi:MAG: cardiolipin synthase [Rhodobacteraceae bacterium]|nr:cardiolipin synthase [Paracoccaceae bacterium]
MEAGATIIVTVLLHYALQVVVLVRALSRPDREPASRVAWVLVIMGLPAVGIVLYLLLGEVNPGRRRALRMREVRAALPVAVPGMGAAELPAAARPAFARGAAVNGFAPVGGNHATLTADSDAAVAALVADIDAATDSVHVLVYIWLDDTNGRALMAAMTRAAARGVVCRAMVDGLGSRGLLRSEGWAAMKAAGVRTGIAFDTRWAAARLLLGRIDIRNHRKVFVIDGRIAYCGSQNCADPAFLPKARFAPWVDILVRLEGPVAWQTQVLFAADWMGQGGDDITGLLARAPTPAPDGFAALVVGTGPGLSPNAVPDMVALLLASAEREAVISTPYFVPTQGLDEAIRATALRGVAVTLILPARNDSRMVGWASRAAYAGLLRAGVTIHEFTPGLLHSKTLTADGARAMIGSANLDRRSFELNFENVLLVADPSQTARIRARQAAYLAQSRAIEADEVARWSLPRRVLCNAAAMISPVL